MSRRNRLLTAAAAGATVLSLLAGCSQGGQGTDSARAAASSLAANPQYQHDKAQAEALLLKNFKKDFQAAHPITSMMSAVQDTFPGGSSTKIVNYAVKTFTLSDAHGKARAAWIQGVVTYALTQGAAGIPSGAATPAIPGVTSPAATS